MKALLCICLILIIYLNANSQISNCKSHDIEQVDSCLLNMTLKQAINKLQVDTAQFIPVLLFAREVHGIYIRLQDTCKIMLIVNKPYTLSNAQMQVIETNGWLNGKWKSIYKYVLKEKIVGLCWRKYKQRKMKRLGQMYHNCWDT